MARACLAWGLKPGEKVGVLANTCYDWVVMDFAIASVGAVTVGIYSATPAWECADLLGYADCVLAFVEDVSQAAKLASVRGDLPALRGVVLLGAREPEDDGSVSGDPYLQSYARFLELECRVEEPTLGSARAQVRPEDPAAIVFTSGTGGNPKGAVLTHRNLTFAASSAAACVATRRGDETLLFLPLAHVFARLCVYFSLLTGTITTFARGPESLMEDLRVARPHWFVSVPRLFEKVRDNAQARIESARARRVGRSDGRWP